MTLKQLTYFISLVVLSVLLFIPGFGPIMLVFTAGLAMPLLAVHSLLLYSALIYPTYLAFKAEKFLLAAVLAIPIFVVALFPLYVTTNLEHQAKEIVIGDVSKATSFRPRHLYFSSHVEPVPSFYSNLAAAPCVEVCQHLLLEGFVEQITVVPQISSSGFDGKPFSELTYAAAERADCSVAFESQGHLATPLTKETLEARQKGRCIEIVEPLGKQDLRVVIEEERKLGSPSPIRGGIRSIKRIKLVRHQPPEVVFQKTYVEGDTLIAPFLVGMFGGYGLEMKFDSVRRRFSKGEPFDNETVIRRLLSAPPKSSQVPTVATQRPTVSEVNKLLDRLAASVEKKNFGPDVDRLLEFQTNAAGPSKEEVKTFERILSDVRIIGIAFVVDNIKERPEAVATLLPAILDRLEKQTTRDDQLGSMQYLAEAASRLSLERIKPFRGRIIEILSRDGTDYLNPLAKIAGQLGLEAAVVLHKRMVDKIQLVRLTAYEAVCRSDAEVISQMQSQILETLDSRLRARTGQGDYQSGDNMLPLAIAMKRIGNDNIFDLHARDYSSDYVQRIRAAFSENKQLSDLGLCGPY